MNFLVNKKGNFVSIANKLVITKDAMTVLKSGSDVGIAKQTNADGEYQGWTTISCCETLDVDLTKINTL